MQKKLVYLSIIFFLNPILLSHALVILDFSNAFAVHSTAAGIASRSDNASSAKISQTTSPVKYVDGKTLILTNEKQYSLSGVKILDLTQNRSIKAKSLNVKLAEMTFIDGRLTEVVLRLR